MIGPDRERPVVALQSLRRSIEFEEGDPAIVERVRIVRLDCDRFVIGGRRFRVAPETDERVAEIAQRLGLVRIYRQRFAIAIGQRLAASIGG